MTSYEEAVREWSKALSLYITSVNVGLACWDGLQLSSVTGEYPADELSSLIDDAQLFGARWSGRFDYPEVPLGLMTQATASRWIYHEYLRSIATPLDPDEVPPGADPIEVALRVSIFTTEFVTDRLGAMLPPRPVEVDLGFPVVVAAPSRTLRTAAEHRFMCQEVAAKQLLELDFPDSERELVRSALFDV